VPGRHGRARRGRSVLGRSVRVVAWLVIVASIAVLTVAVALPRVAGATPYTVLTGSMTPAYPPGTLVVVRPVDPDQIAVGDVVTYQLRSGEPTVVTHRVVSVGVDTTTGEPVFRTQGDANASPDLEPVQPVQVRGRLWYAVPHLGRVSAWLTGRQRQLLVDLVAALLLGYAGAQVLRSVRHRRDPLGAAS
jgi:signal peptidase I